MRALLGRVRSRLLITALILAAFLALATAAVKVGASRGTPADLAYNPENLIRLHIIANSDSEADQALKRAVRDEIVKRTSGLFRGARDYSAAREVVQNNLRMIENIGQEKVYAAGFSYPVRAEFGRYPFPAKTYGSLMLPPGKYQAVRVVIGEGKGKNWWCVLFPPLCFLKMDAPLANGRVSVTRRPAAKPGTEGRPERLAQAGTPVQVKLAAPGQGELPLLLGFPMTTPTRVTELLDAAGK